jgi:hypothetical protein
MIGRARYGPSSVCTFVHDVLGPPPRHAFLGTNQNCDVRKASANLRLQPVSPITDSVEVTAVVDADWGKSIAVFKILNVALDFCLAQLAVLFWIDVNQIHGNIGCFVAFVRRSGIGHYASPPRVCAQ